MNPRAGFRFESAALDYCRRPTSFSGDWLENCGIPRGLTRNRISDYVREDRSPVVARHLNWDQPYTSSIHVVPLWDEEHAWSLEFRDGATVAANDSPFRLEAGVLRWID